MRCPRCGKSDMKREVDKKTGIVCLVCCFIYTESDVIEYWNTHSEPEDKNYNPATDRCENCGQSLAGSDFSLPWEDGNNPNAYVRCWFCGHKTIQYGFGED